MEIKTNCINCGAPLHSCKCEYCGTEYHMDSYNRISEYKVKLNIMGQEKEFYIGKVENHRFFTDCQRSADGRLSLNGKCNKLKLELIEI